MARHRLVALLPPSHPLAAKNALTIEDLAGQQLVMGTNAEWPTFRRIVVDAFQTAGQVLNVAQEASSLTGILGLVTAGVGITRVVAACRAFAARTPLPRVRSSPIRRSSSRRILPGGAPSISGAMRRFIETSQKVGKSYML